MRRGVSPASPLVSAPAQCGSFTPFGHEGKIFLPSARGLLAPGLLGYFLCEQKVPKKSLKGAFAPLRIPQGVSLRLMPYFCFIFHNRAGSFYRQRGRWMRRTSASTHEAWGWCLPSQPGELPEWRALGVRWLLQQKSRRSQFLCNPSECVLVRADQRVQMHALRQQRQRLRGIGLQNKLPHVIPARQS